MHVHLLARADLSAALENRWRATPSPLPFLPPTSSLSNEIGDAAFSSAEHCSEPMLLEQTAAAVVVFASRHS